MARSGRFGPALWQACLVDHRPLFACSRHRKRNSAIADIERQRCRRNIAVAVGQPVGENIGHPARRSGLADVGVVPVRLDEQMPVLARDKHACC